jgi:hypothetical protein
MPTPWRFWMDGGTNCPATIAVSNVTANGGIEPCTPSMRIGSSVLFLRKDRQTILMDHA